MGGALHLPFLYRINLHKAINSVFQQKDWWELRPPVLPLEN